MKILLTQDVFKLGNAGEVKVVADGYGRNYLLPQGMAVLATPGALKRADNLRERALKLRAAQQTEVDAMAKVINGAALHFVARSGEKGKLFGSITAQNIADKLTAHLKSETPFDKRKIMLREPIREIGSQQVTIRLGHDVNPQVTVVVTPEGVVGREPVAQVVAAPEVVAAEAEASAAA